MSDENVVSIKDFYNQDSRIITLENAIVNINNSLSRIEQRMSEDRSEMRTYFKWTMGGILGSYTIMLSTLITVICKFSH